MNSELMDRYARVLVEHGLNLQPEQPLFIRGEQIHRDLVRRISAAAYERGSSVVHWRLLDPLEQAQLIRRGRREQLVLFHEQTQRWVNEALRCRAAVLILVGEEFPELMAELARQVPERHAVFMETKNRAQAVFATYGVNGRLCPWSMAAGPTPAWAEQLFPDLPSNEALTRLAALITSFCRADDPTARELAEARLEHRLRTLDQLAIRELRVMGGGNDLRLQLAPGARWLGGRQRTLAGQAFYPNLPSEEVFITPDYRATEGRLVASRPFRTPSGVLVEDLTLSFSGGKVVEHDASRGQQAFEQHLATDRGARYLGEFALVGEDSPLAQCGLYFDRILFDENACSHVALGLGFVQGLPGGETLSAAELEQLGCNRSATHSDIPFGAPDATVVARRSAEGEVVLLEDGAWSPRFTL